MLKLQSEISTKDLSYLLGIRQQSLNELLNKLEKSYYVSRIPSEKDKRVMLVRLTEKGENAQQKEADFSGIFDCLKQEEQIIFSEYLDRIIAALETKVGINEEEDLSEWITSARSRMSDDQFEQIMAMRRGMHGFYRGMEGRGHCDMKMYDELLKKRGPFPFGRKCDVKASQNDANTHDDEK